MPCCSIPVRHLSPPEASSGKTRRAALGKTSQASLVKMPRASLGKMPQAALGKIAILPAIMLLCYLVLIGYFKAAGGYRAHHLVAEGVVADGVVADGVPGG